MFRRLVGSVRLILSGPGSSSRCRHGLTVRLSADPDPVRFVSSGRPLSASPRRRSEPFLPPPPPNGPDYPPRNGAGSGTDNPTAASC